MQEELEEASASEQNGVKRMSKDEVMEECAKALEQVTDTCLGHVFVQFPGQTNWQSFYVMVQDCQLLFYNSMKDSAFKYSYVVNRVTIRKTQKYLGFQETDNESGGHKVDLRKIDVLILTHSYDTNVMYLTAPLLFTCKERHPEFQSIVLETLQEKIQNQAEVEPNTGITMDCTNRYSWGKIFVRIKNIINFPYLG